MPLSDVSYAKRQAEERCEECGARHDNPEVFCAACDPTIGKE